MRLAGFLGQLAGHLDLLAGAPPDWPFFLSGYRILSPSSRSANARTWAARSPRPMSSM